MSAPEDAHGGARAWDGMQDLRVARSRVDLQADGQQAVDFLLRAAVRSSLRINHAGWWLRGLALVTTFLIVLGVPLALVCLLIVFVGWAIAGVELYHPDLIDRYSSEVGPLAPLARHLHNVRGVALPSISGILENGGAALLLFAVARDGSRMPILGRDSALVLTAGYAGVAAAQVLTDPGYYNKNEEVSSPTWWVAAFRWALVPLYAGAAIVLEMLATPAVTIATIGVTVVAFGSVHLTRVLSDSILEAALGAYSNARLTENRRLLNDLSSDLHRLTQTFTDLSRRSTNPQVTGAYGLAFAEIEALRTKFATGRDRPETLFELLQSIDRKSPESERISTSTDHPDAVLATGSATFLRNVIFDLTGNARDANADRILVKVEITERRKWSMWVDVQVSDDGPGFTSSELMTVYPPGSSRAALAASLQGRRGSLDFTRVDGRTTARARFRAARWVASA